MNISGNQILITGGATGIGLALADALARGGNEVAVCGRRRERLEEARKLIPGLQVLVCDVSQAAARRSLLEWALASLPKLNVLVNNAGIQRIVDFRQGTHDMETAAEEVAINLEAPIRLSGSFLPHLLDRPESAIVNITSGLGFAIAPEEVAEATVRALEEDRYELAIGMAERLREGRERLFDSMNP